MAFFPLAPCVVHLSHLVRIHAVLIETWYQDIALVELRAAVGTKSFLTATIGRRHEGSRHSLLRIAHTIQVSELLVHVTLHASALRDAEIGRSVDTGIAEATLASQALGRWLLGRRWRPCIDHSWLGDRGYDSAELAAVM